MELSITVVNHLEQLVLGFRISILVILASKKAQKQIARSRICHHQQQKCYRNPFFCHFQKVLKLPFLFGRALKDPPTCRVKEEGSMKEIGSLQSYFLK